MLTKTSKSKNNATMSARKKRNDKELAKLKKAEGKLPSEPTPGSKNDLLLRAIKKKRKALESQNKLIKKYLASNSKSKRASLKKQIEETSLPPFPYTKAGSICIKCLEKKAKLVKVDFLDGSDTKALSGGEGKQFVNLPLNNSRRSNASLTTSSKVKKWVSSKFAKNLDRVGASVRVKAEVSPALPGIPVYFRLVGDSNAKYTKMELNRNSNFRDQTATPSTPWRVLEFTNHKGIAIARLKVSQAGGNIYEVQAKTLDGTNEKGDEKIKTDRLVYYKEYKMDSTKVKEATNLQKFKDAFEKGNITMESLGKTKMKHLPNIGEDTSEFKKELRSAFAVSDAKDKLPFVIAIAYTDHLAVKRANKYIRSKIVDVGPGKPSVKINVLGDGLTNQAVKPRYLWKNLVPGESWIGDGENPVYFYPSDGSARVRIDPGDCEPLPNRLKQSGSSYVAVSSGNPDKCQQIRIKVSNLPAGKGVVKIKINWVDRMRGGLALGENNAALVCTRAWWEDVSNIEQVHVMIHEVGHKVQMVADGTGCRPDKVDTHYWGGDVTKFPGKTHQGHVGDHCYNGNAAGQARYDAPTDAENAICVMYGSTNPSLEFCANCKPAVRKVDMTGGWTSI